MFDLCLIYWVLKGREAFFILLKIFTSHTTLCNFNGLFVFPEKLRVNKVWMGPSVPGSTYEKGNWENIKAYCWFYPSQKVYFVWFYINYTKGHRCWKLNVSPSTLQLGLFVCLAGMLSIRQTRLTLLFCREVAGFCRASGVVVLYVCGTTWLCASCRGQSGHSVTTDGQEKPRGHLKSHRQCSLHTVCVHVLVCVTFIRGSILVFLSKCV